MVKIRYITIILTVLAALLFAGCADGEEDYDETTIRISRSGKVSESIVESFDKDYYDINELTSEFGDSVSKYNESIGSDEIKLKKIDLRDSKVYVDLDFNTPSDYEEFIGESLFVGTISDAYDNGYTMDVVLKGIEDGDKIGKVQIMGMKDRDIIILSEHARIRSFRDIAYVSANVDVIGSKEARVLSESDGLAYLILK